MRIEELAPVDVDEVTTLWTQCGLTRPWNDPEADYARALTGNSSTVLGLRSETRDLIGTAMVGLDGHRGWLYYLAVDPSERNRGHGRAPMTVAQEWLLARGMPKMQFMVRTDNRAVLDFYAHLGYEVQDCVVIGRRLDGCTRRAEDVAGRPAPKLSDKPHDREPG